MATSGSEVEVECVASGGNPPPGLQWYVGGERWEGTTEAINQETGVTVSIVSFPVEQADHKKEIRCEVVHEALRDRLEVETDLDVQCKSQLTGYLMFADRFINCSSTCDLAPVWRYFRYLRGGPGVRHLCGDCQPSRRRHVVQRGQWGDRQQAGEAHHQPHQEGAGRGVCLPGKQLRGSESAQSDRAGSAM